MDVLEGEVHESPDDRAVATCTLRTYACPWWVGTVPLVRFLVAQLAGSVADLRLETRLVRIGGRWFVHDASLVPQLNEA
jgi:hypothetical protein